MAIPEGYEKLAVIGIAYKGDYVEGAVYHRLNAVYYDGSTYVAIRDAPVGPPTADGANWQYLAKGFLEGVLSAVEAVDTSGVLGTAGARVDAQDLIDALADRVMVKLIAKSQIVNNLLATTPGNVLDAVQGKNLKDQIDTLNLDFEYFRLAPTLNSYVTKLGWGNYMAGSRSYFVLNLALTAAKTIPAGTIIGTLPFNVIEMTVPLLSPAGKNIIVYGSNIRIEGEIASGTNILANIGTRAAK